VAYWFLQEIYVQAVLLDLVVANGLKKIIGLFRKVKHNLPREKKIIVHENPLCSSSGSSGILNIKLVHFCYKNYEDYKYKMLKIRPFKKRPRELIKKKKINYLF